MRKIPMIIAAGAFGLAACGRASTGGASTPTGVAGAPTAAPTLLLTAQPATVAPTTMPPTAQPAPEASPAMPGGGLGVRPPDALVAAAQRQLAAYLKVDANALMLQSANEQEWPDGGLGCPKEGMAYPQVVTPGFLLVFTDAAQAQSYEVHTAMSETPMLLCADKQPIELGATAADTPNAIADASALGDDARRALDLAQAALARELNIQPSEVTFVQAVPVEWNDSSLGCPKPDQAYMQVITAGYRLTVQAQGKTYEYHTDLGKRVVRCEQ